MENTTETRDIIVAAFPSVERVIVSDGPEYYRREIFRTIHRILETGDVVLGVCPGGIERSAIYNRAMSNVGCNVAGLDVHGFDSPFYGHPCWGVGFSRLLPLISSAEIVDEGILFLGVDQPVRRLVIIMSSRDIDLVVQIGQKLTTRIRQNGHNPAPITIDVIIEDDYNLFEENMAILTQSFGFHTAFIEQAVAMDAAVPVGSPESRRQEIRKQEELPTIESADILDAPVVQSGMFGRGVISFLKRRFGRSAQTSS